MESEDTVSLDLVVRGFNSATDLPFLLKTWLLSWRSSRARVSSLIYFKSQEQLIKDIVQRRSARAVCCVDKHNPDFILGVAVGESYVSEDPYEPLVLHWVFTKLAYRKLGIAREMLKELGWYEGRTIHATHKTVFVLKNADKFRILENDYPLKGVYNGRFVTYSESKIYNSRNSAVGRTDSGADT